MSRLNKSEQEDLQIIKNLFSSPDGRAVLRALKRRYSFGSCLSENPAVMGYRASRKELFEELERDITLDEKRDFISLTNGD